MSQGHVLIVEDEPDIGELIKFHLDREGFATRVIRSGREALEAIRREPPDAVVLDLMLPDVDGFEICRRMRWEDRTRDVPILIVSARGEEADIVSGLELGADDYVTKPFSPKVLLARLRNLLRRGSGKVSAGAERRRLEVASGALVVDLDERSVIVSGAPISLTRTEFDILHCLVSRPGFVRTRDQIISTVHGNNIVLTGRTVDVHMTAIRRKLGELGVIIRTVRGVGYRIDESALEPTS